jgi:hypothetical protein
MNMEMKMSDTRIYIETTDIAAKVYAQNDKGVYYAKVDMPSIGLFINSITVRPSPNYAEKGLWVQWPAFFTGRGKWTKPVEWKGGSALKGILEDAVLRAVDAYNQERYIVPEGDVTLPALSELDDLLPP